jgi:hypothetical protein
MGRSDTRRLPCLPPARWLPRTCTSSPSYNAIGRSGGYYDSERAPSPARPSIGVARSATDLAGELRSGWQSRSRWVPSGLTRLADQATEENNELRGHSPEELGLAPGRTR